MKTLMRLRRALPLLLALALPLHAADPAPDPRPLAVLVYADWCFNCKQMLPRLAPLQEEFGSRIRFERLNVTSDETKVGAREQARVLGISKIYYANKGTGLVALIDPQRHKLGELRVTQTDEQLHAALAALAAGEPLPAPASDYATPPEPAKAP